MIIKLTKKEKEFLIDWLSDDLYIANDDLRRHQGSKEIVKELNQKIKIFKSVINKLTTKKGNKNGIH